MEKKVLFETISPGDSTVVGPRLGRLTVLGRNQLETPNFLAVSSRGAVPHLTPDVVSSSTYFGGVHMALEDFIEKSTTDKPPVIKGPRGPLHDFTSTQQSIIALAPRRTPTVTAPNGNSDTAISIFTSTGFQTLSNKSYIAFIQALRPDIIIALADLTYGPLPGTKRIAKMGDRTQEWLLELLSESDNGGAVFASILPISSDSQNEYLNCLTDELVDKISGLAFYDSSLLPDVCTTTSLSQVPRLSLDEPASPHHIVRQISLGMDIFTIPFINFATDAGIALTFRFPRPLPNETHGQNDAGLSIVPLGIDMWTSTHAVSLLPLSTSCPCYTCTSHHRAYIQHLLSAKEMLGWVLLQIHNHHIITTFFANIRSSLHQGTFDVDSVEFARVYESELPEKSGQGPRVRGYHFKSEGPGGVKKNKAPWGNLAVDN